MAVFRFLILSSTSAYFRFKSFFPFTFLVNCLCLILLFTTSLTFPWYSINQVSSLIFCLVLLQRLLLCFKLISFADESRRVFFYMICSNVFYLRIFLVTTLCSCILLGFFSEFLGEQFDTIFLELRKCVEFLPLSNM